VKILETNVKKYKGAIGSVYYYGEVTLSEKVGALWWKKDRVFKVYKHHWSDSWSDEDGYAVNTFRIDNRYVLRRYS